MEIKIYTTLTPTLKREWRMLWNNHPNATIANSAEWFDAGVKAYHNKSCIILAVYENTTLVAVVGLVKIKRYGMTIYTSAAEEFIDSCPLLIDFSNTQTLSLLCTALQKIGNVYLTSFTTEQGDVLKRMCPTISMSPGDTHAFVDFSDGKYGKMSHKSINNLINRSKKIKTMRFILEANDLSRALQTAFIIEKRSAKMQKGKGVFHNKNHRNFYIYLTRSLPQHISIATLFFDKTPIAYSIGFETSTTYLPSQKAHIPEYNYYKPGKLLALHLMDYWREKSSASGFSLGKGYDTFKMDFTDKTRHMYNIFLTSNSVLKHYLFFSFRLRNTLYQHISHYQPLYVFYKRTKSMLFA